MVSRGGNCRWSSRQPRRCTRCSPAGPAYGGWQRILDALRDRLRVRAGRDRCPTAAIIDSQTVPAADTVPRSGRGWDGGTRTNGVKRHLAVDVNGLLLTVVVTAASIPDRDAAHRLLAALRGSFSTIGLVWADGGYLGRLLIWAKDVLTLTMQIIKRIPGATGFHVRPRIWVVERSFAWINKHRRCARDYGYDSTLHSFDKAAGKLGIDAIDLLILHQALPGEFDLTVGACKALERLYADGRVRAIGVSNFMPRPLDRLLAETDVVPAINQIEVHPYFRQSELLPVDNRARHPESGVGADRRHHFLPRGPAHLHAGESGDRRDRGEAFEDSGAGDAALAHPARPPGDPQVPHPSRIEENFDGFDFDLTDEQLAAIDALDTGIRGGPEPEDITRENYAIEIPEA